MFYLVYFLNFYYLFISKYSLMHLMFYVSGALVDPSLERSMFNGKEDPTNEKTNSFR